MSVTIGASFGCPFEGRVEPEPRVRAAPRLMHEHHSAEIMLADTIGVGVPSQVRELVAGVAALGAIVGCHLHNTRNTGYANALAAVEAGALLLDASCGGIGGCPFAPKATGNIATEDLVYMLHGMGIETGIDLAAAGRDRRVAVRRAGQGASRPDVQGRDVRADRRLNARSIRPQSQEGSAMNDDLFETGLEIRREVLGREYVDASMANTDEFSADFQRLLPSTAGARLGAEAR